ncbi:hypothetical protein C7H19_01825 [Aphanothece hegewaldii CCALA 016]|uniref:DUF2281 domain-containing protein n=1 Tax=Aphanothece hegewaldii CCALA 016 TaxID=2107694 RepID=A0A2T1M3Y3_9CHRO|nr:hypothetical protein [Aphanothece hegewaldii]PSF39553.1 hypothetical protein C7H19_01825 [Aphanothece hegewaldii CCALA 016]
MNNQTVKEKINEYLEQLPDAQLVQVANFVEELFQEQQINLSKRQLIRSLKGKYSNVLTPTEIISQKKQDELTWENEN